MSFGERGARRASAISCAFWLTLPLRERIVRKASPRLFCRECRDPRPPFARGAATQETPRPWLASLLMVRDAEPFEGTGEEPLLLDGGASRSGNFSMFFISFGLSVRFDLESRHCLASWSDTRCPSAQLEAGEVGETGVTSDSGAESIGGSRMRKLAIIEKDSWRESGLTEPSGVDVEGIV